MILLRSGGWHHPAGTTETTELAKHLDISLGVDCYIPLVLEPEGPMMPCLEIATQAVHFTECNGLCRQCSGGVPPQKMLLRSEIPRGMSAKLRTVAANSNRVHMR